MRKISLQWRLTILTTVLITVLCGCLTFFLYKNGVYYFNTLQETVTDQNGTPDAIKRLLRIKVPHRRQCILIFRIMNGMILQHSFP